MENKIIQEILKRETRGLNICDETKDVRIFTYLEAEELLNELAERLEVKKEIPNVDERNENYTHSQRKELDLNRGSSDTNQLGLDTSPSDSISTKNEMCGKCGDYIGANSTCFECIEYNDRKDNKGVIENE